MIVKITLILGLFLLVPFVFIRIYHRILHWGEIYRLYGSSLRVDILGLDPRKFFSKRKLYVYFEVGGHKSPENWPLRFELVDEYLLLYPEPTTVFRLPKFAFTMIRVYEFSGDDDFGIEAVLEGFGWMGKPYVIHFAGTRDNILLIFSFLQESTMAD